MRIVLTAHRISASLAVRSLQHANRRTNFFIVLILVLLIINLLLLSSIIDNIDQATGDQIIDHQYGHMFLEPEESEEIFENPQSYVRTLRNIPGVIGVSPHFVVQTIVVADQKSSATEVHFIDPVYEETVTQKSRFIIDGNYLGTHDETGIILGSEKAGGPGTQFPRLSLGGVNVGDEVVMLFGNDKSQRFDVRGVFFTKLIDADFYIYANEAQMASIYGRDLSDLVNQIVVRIDPSLTSEQSVIDQMRSKGYDGNYFITRESQGFVLTETLFVIKIIILIVSLLVSSGSLFITMYINVFSRKKFYGVLQAIGVPYSIVILSTVYQSLFLVCSASILAVIILYFVLVPYFAAYPLDLPFAFVSLSIDPSSIAMSIFFFFLLAIISSLLPLWSLYKNGIINLIR